MIFRFIHIIIFFSFGFAFCQVDSISYQFKYDLGNPIIEVEQVMHLHRENTDSTYYFYAWANAYKDRTTDLSSVKLNQRNDHIYFTNLDDRGWLENIHFSLLNNENKDIVLPYSNPENELIKVFVPSAKELKIKVNYDIHLPLKKFTGYGRAEDGSLLLKYFFIQPEYRENGKLVKQTFQDFESLTVNNTSHTLNVNVPDGFDVYTDLRRLNVNQYIGKNRDFFEVAIQKKDQVQTFNTIYGTVIFDKTFPSEDKVLMQKIITQQLKFLNNKLGVLNEPLFISNKSFKQNQIKGIEDIHLPIINKKYKIFFVEDRIKLEMISQLTDAYLERKVSVNIKQDHWLRHGLAHYFMLEYMEQEMPDLKLAGKIPEDFRVMNFKPLKYLNASKVKMSDRSQWIYRILLQSNFNQSIDTPFDELSNLNQILISGVKAGLSFQYLSDYIGKEKFNQILKHWINEGDNLLTKESLKQYIKNNTPKTVDWFFDDLIQHNGWYDIGITSVDKNKDSLQIKFKNKGDTSIPFKLSAYKKNHVDTFWLKNNQSTFTTQIANKDYDKLVIHDSLKLPDFKLSNDVYYLNSFFHRKVKIGIGTDIPLRDYNQIFLLPVLSWNNYDKLQLGLTVSNRTPLPQTWVYTIKPQYATGENDLTGRFAIERNVYPNHHWFRRLRITTRGSYQHYNRGLAYKTLGFGVQGDLKKEARSTKNRSLYVFHQLIDRDLRKTANDKQFEINKYGLLNIGYNHWNTHIIHERRMQVNMQVSNNFSKISGEYYYRWKFAKNKRIGVRLYAASFLKHDLNYSDYFDFGLDRVSDYSFSLPLLGRSEKTGVLSQQYVLQEGGFKSNFYRKSNHMMFTANWEFPIWKIIDAYADWGYVKNKKEKGDFLYDTGVRVRILPDFLEFYFPIQSSLGFEPTLGAYHQRIRFMLDFDLNKLMSYWRRGKN